MEKRKKKPQNVQGKNDSDNRFLNFYVGIASKSCTIPDRNSFSLLLVSTLSLKKTIFQSEHLVGNMFLFKYINDMLHCIPI